MGVGVEGLEWWDFTVGGGGAYLAEERSMQVWV